MVTDEQRGRYGRWLRHARLGKGWSVDEARARLSRGGYKIGESSYAEWESGRKRPSRDAMPHLVALFGDPPPEPTLVPADAPTPDLATLVARLDRQAEAIDRLAAAVELLARGQDETLRGFLEGLADLRRAPEGDPASASHAGTR